ncbi:AraC family transcriptional regulator [Marinomonas epiphytica]
MTANSLKNLLDHFTINCDVFFSGQFCGGKALGNDMAEGSGHLHYLRSGRLTIRSQSGQKVTFDQPTIILLPVSTSHQVITEETEQAELVCAEVHFMGREHRHMLNNLPKLLFLPLNSSAMTATVEWLFDEIYSDALGKKALVGKLCDVLLIQMLRDLTEQGVVIQGMLAGLTHPTLGPVLAQLQESPEEAWTLDMMAQQANMSRSKFAQLFRATLGQTPNDFLTDLRLSLAQQLLKQNTPVSLVANQVGYEHGSVLSRVFRKKTGLSPKEWLQKFNDPS